MLTHLYGITEEAPEGENLQTQAPQAHEGESPQKAFTLQVVIARVSIPRPSNLQRALRAPPSVGLRHVAPATTLEA
jgi:hypothetical protein